MDAHPAQPFTEESFDVVGLLDEQIAILGSVRLALVSTRPTRAKKNELMRRLSGVLGRVETIRLALK
jgi:hypothetical protein